MLNLNFFLTFFSGGRARAGTGTRRRSNGRGGGQGGGAGLMGWWQGTGRKGGI